MQSKFSSLICQINPGKGTQQKKIQFVESGKFQSNKIHTIKLFTIFAVFFLRKQKSDDSIKILTFIIKYITLIIH